jgi:hypothetical protein
MSSKIYPVVHCREWTEAHFNAHLAAQCGCDGVFFISHGSLTPSSIKGLARVFSEQALEKYPATFQVGVNFLGVDTALAFTFIEDCAGMLWYDDAALEDPFARAAYRACKYHGALKATCFGGVAFKYQRQPRSLVDEARKAVGKVDVLTTSGDATGEPPSLFKLASLAEGFGQKIAVASGVTPMNVKPMLPFVEHILAATGISQDFYNLDINLCKRLVDVVRSQD